MSISSLHFLSEIGDVNNDVERMTFLRRIARIIASSDRISELTFSYPCFFSAFTWPALESYDVLVIQKLICTNKQTNMRKCGCCIFSIAAEDF